MRSKKNLLLPCVAMSILLFLSSCYSTKNMVYFQDLTDSTRVRVQDSVSHYQALIQPGDMLDIFVNSINPQAAAIFHLNDTSA